MTLKVTPQSLQKFLGWTKSVQTHLQLVSHQESPYSVCEILVQGTEPPLFFWTYLYVNPFSTSRNYNQFVVRFGE